MPTCAEKIIRRCLSGFRLEDLGSERIRKLDPYFGNKWFAPAGSNRKTAMEKNITGGIAINPEVQDLTVKFPTGEVVILGRLKTEKKS